MSNTVTEYMDLVAAALASPTDAHIDAVEAFEAAHPEVIDAAYQQAGPMTYDPVAGVVYTEAAA